MARGRPLLSHAPLTFRFILGRGDELRSALQLHHIYRSNGYYLYYRTHTHKQMDNPYPPQTTWVRIWVWTLVIQVPGRISLL